MESARVKSRAHQLFAEAVDGSRAETGHLDRLITDLAEPSKHITEPRRIVQETPQRVELDRYHGWIDRLTF